MPDDPANDNKERGDEKSNLDAGPNGHSHGQVHLVANGDYDSGHVLLKISKMVRLTNGGLTSAALPTMGIKMRPMKDLLMPALATISSMLPTR